MAPACRRDDGGAWPREKGKAMADRTGWAFGKDDGGEWLRISGSAPTPPVLHLTREMAEAALATSSLRDSGLSVAHVAEVSRPGGTRPGYLITPGTCRKPGRPA
jgi:hypothetical protein